ncbi:MAG: hypothetical protein ACI4GA_06455 [Acutalibacteraceae bacterium]
MTTLYIITRFITVPGAMIRGFWEQLICRIHKVAVEDNRYLRRDELCSHVEHEFMPKAGSAFAICFVPMLLQLLLAFLVSAPAAFDILYLGSFKFPISLIDAACLWVGFSLLVNCFPSIEDAMNMMDKLYHGNANMFSKIIFAIGAGICYVGAFIERYCVTFLSSLAILVAFILLV